MSISLEQLRKANKVYFSELPRNVFNNWNAVRNSLNNQLSRACLKTKVALLTSKVLPYIQDQKTQFNDKPQRLSLDQLMAILYLAPGHKDVKIGELTNPLKLHKEEIGIQLLAVMESTLTEQGKVTPISHIWGIDESGTSYNLGIFSKAERP